MPCVLYMVWWSKIWTVQSKYNPTCHFNQMLLQIGCPFSITWSCCMKTNSKSPGHVVINNNFILFWFNWSYIYDNIWYIYTNIITNVIKIDLLTLVGQVLPVSAAEGGHTVRSFALLVRHSCSAGLVRHSGRAGRLWPRGTRARLHQWVPLRPQSNPWAGGEGGGAAPHLQVRPADLHREQWLPELSINEDF